MCCPESADSTIIGVGVVAADADVIASVEIAVVDIVAGAGVEGSVADIAADDVAIAVPTLFNLADAPCCNNFNALG